MTRRPTHRRPNRRRAPAAPWHAAAPWLAAAAAASLVLAGCSSRPGIEIGTAPDSAELRSGVVEAGLRAHLAALQEAADAYGGNRASGTGGYEASAAYVEARLRDAGYDPVRQGFSHEGPDDEDIETFNIVADTAGDASRTVVLGAHLDSVEQGPGINDNGSGVAAVLEVAVRLAASGTVPPNRIRFAFWGGEEDGLYGSEHYVDGLSDEQAEQHLAYLNLDMVGSPNGAVLVYDGDGSDYGGRLPNGSGEIERLFLDHFSAVGVPAGPTEFDGGSDYEAFMDRGIPSGGLFTGDEGSKSGPEAAAFGGTAGEEYDACYHRSCDTLGNVDPEVLESMADALMHATLALGEAGTDD